MFDYTVNGLPARSIVTEFPSGEKLISVQRKVTQDLSPVVDIIYDFKVHGDSSIFYLAQLVDALRIHYRNPKVCLTIPYLTHSRQDRACNIGESFSLHVWADLINSMRFHSVYTLDIHSEVSKNIYNLYNQPPHRIFYERMFKDDVRDGHTLLVAPDKGARPRVNAMRKAFRAEELLICSKVRDTATGKLLSYKVDNPSLLSRYKSLTIVDDICDGGGTFMLLAEAVRKINKDIKLELMVTHGLFTKGVDHLLEYYDHIYTTDSVCTIKHPKVTIINV